MLTAGVDLAAEAKGTALAVLDWSGPLVRMDVATAVADADIAGVAPGVACLGIDCAFGWPDDFVSFRTRRAGAWKRATSRAWRGGAACPIGRPTASRGRSRVGGR